MMSMRTVKAWLWNHGWTVPGPRLRAAFPAGLPATVGELQEWAERALPRPIGRPPEPRIG